MHYDPIIDDERQSYADQVRRVVERKTRPGFAPQRPSENVTAPPPEERLRHIRVPVDLAMALSDPFVPLPHLGDDHVPAPEKVTIAIVIRHVAMHYKVSVAEIKGHRRNHPIVRIRHIAMYLAKTITRNSLPEIGRRFGGKDHTSVLNAVRRITALVESDPAFADEIGALKAVIHCLPCSTVEGCGDLVGNCGAETTDGGTKEKADAALATLVGPNGLTLG